MCEERTRHVTNRLLAKLGCGADPEDLAALFCRKVDWAVPGDAGALPWIGRGRVGRHRIADYVRQSRALVEPGAFTVDDILVQGERAVILGERSYRVRQTGKPVETEFAIVLTVTGGRIARFRLLEDSFAVSQASR